MTSLAPVLSATSSRVCIWIMGHLEQEADRSVSFVSGPGRHGPPGGRVCSLSGGRLGRLALAGQGLLGALPDDPDDPPPLELGEGAGLHDLDDVAHVRLVGLVVRVADGTVAEQLAVLGVREEALDL